MTLSLDSGQATLAQRISVGSFPLVVLETFTDRDAGTVDSTYYWTRGAPLKYEWDGATAVFFEPRLFRVTPISRGFAHIPDAGTLDTREGVTLTLDGTPRAGTYLWQTLLGENIIGARVTVGSLLVDMTDASSDPRWWDLEALGAVHEVRWRGEVTLIPDVAEDSQTFDIICETEEPPLTFERMTAPLTASVRDLGKKYPIPLGEADQLIPLQIDTGGATILTTAVNTVATGTFYCQDVSKFRHDSPWKNAFIGSEVVRYDSVDYVNNTINVTIRDVDSTGPYSHEPGAPVLDAERNPRWALAADPIRAVRNVWVLHQSGQWQAIDPGYNGGNSYWLENTDFADPNGYRACLAIDPVTLSIFSGAGSYLMGNTNGTPIEIRVDVDGIYTLDGSPSQLFDVDAADATNWTGTRGSISDISGGVRLTTNSLTTSQIACFQRSLPAGTYDSGEMTFDIELDSTSLANLSYIFFELADSGDTVSSTHLGITNPSGRVRTHVTGQNLTAATATPVRLNCYNHVGDRDASAVDELRVYICCRTNLTAVSLDITDGIDYDDASAVDDHPIDYVEDWLGTNAGMSADSSSFSTAKTNLPSVTWKGDVAALGESFGGALARFGYECRTNFVQTETSSATEMKAHNAKTSLDFNAATRSLDTFNSLIFATKAINEVANQFEVIYNLIPGGDPTRVEDYETSFLANETDNPMSAKVATADITTSQTNVGVRPSVPSIFTLISDETSMIEIFSYYAQESMRADGVRLSCVVPYWLGYDLEPGDIVDITPAWASSAIKVRVISTTFDFDLNGIGLNLEEVD